MDRPQDFLDRVKLFFSAGNGGKGALSFEKTRNRTPDGGNGGKGGDIFLKSTFKFSSLNVFKARSHFYADNGGNGGGKIKAGKNAEDLILEVPVGTSIYDEEHNLIHEFKNENHVFCLLKGGKGGVGNASLLSATNQRNRETVESHPGEKKWFIVDFTYPSDICLFGGPASGKTSFLSSFGHIHFKKGEHGFKHRTPFLATYEKKKIIEIPTISKDNRHFIKHLNGSKIIIFFISKIDHINFIKNSIDFGLINEQKKYIFIPNEEIETKDYIASLIKQIKKNFHHIDIEKINCLDHESCVKIIQKIIQNDQKPEILL